MTHLPDDVQKWIRNNYPQDDIFGGEIEIAWTLACEAMYHHLSPRIQELEKQVAELKGERETNKSGGQIQ